MPHQAGPIVALSFAFGGRRHAFNARTAGKASRASGFSFLLVWGGIVHKQSLQVVETKGSTDAGGHTGEKPNFLKAGVGPAEEAEQDHCLSQIKHFVASFYLRIDPVL